MPQVNVEPLEPKAGMLEMVQVVENKKRNLEKRKQKLEALQAKPAELTEQQKEAITHIGEVNGNIQYIEEILTRFKEIQAQVDKWAAIEAKKEKIANQRNKRSAKKNGESVPAETAANDAQEASADATPRSRGSVCDAQHASAANEKDAVAQSVPANTTGSFSKTAGDATPDATVAATSAQPEHNVHLHQQHVEDAAVPQRDDGVPADEEGATPKETMTFVNSQAGADPHAQGDGERPFSGRPHHGGPRRDFRYHDGPRGGYGYGQQFGRPPRRGGRGPYRGGPRGPPRGGFAPHAGAHVAPAPTPAN